VPRIKSLKSKETVAVIIEEVDTFEELGPRMHELILASPAGTRIYVTLH
jgi:hypothetical protein